MESTLRKLSEFQTNDKSHIVQLLLGEAKYTVPSTSTSPISFYNQNLNESQKKAIQFSLDSNISIIHGPPGTGKTFTLIEIIQQLLKTGKSKRILVCGASNICVDTILERLVNVAGESDVFSKSELLRIGHPSRLLQSIQETSLENILYSNSSDNDANIVLKELHGEINNCLNVKLKKTKSYKERREIYQDVKLMRKDVKLREKRYIKELILSSKIVVSTLHGSGSKELTDCYKDYPNTQNITELFDTVIIDEVSQSLEPQCWIPLISHPGVKKLIIAGDNKQLSPTIKSDSSKVKKSLEFTLFDRLEKLYGDKFINLLEVQYRMNAKIMEFSSKELYQDRLKCGGGCDDIVLRDLVEGKKDPESSPVEIDGLELDDDLLNEPLVLYDTQGSDFPEQEEDSTTLQPSRYNEMEILVVLKHLEELIKNGIQFSDIGIISPYAAQVSRLKKAVSEKFYDQKIQTTGAADGDTKSKKDKVSKKSDKSSKRSPKTTSSKKKSKADDKKNDDSKIEISTVDGFQGREKQVIIISLVRSNTKGDVGFLSDFKRLNVGITRSKRQLCVIGNTETLKQSNNKFLQSLVDYLERESFLIYPDINDLL